MGTRGLIGYVHKEQKYVKYNGSDSYPEGLGVQLLNEIPSDPEEFKRWLEEKRALLDKVEAEVTEETFDPHPDELSRTSRPIILEGQLEWIYVLNLDRLSFSINNRIHFRLDNLPPADKLVSYIAEDGSFDECIAPWTPRQYRAGLKAHPIRDLNEHGQHALKYYDTCASSTTIEKINPSTWLTPVPKYLALHEKLAFLAAEGFMTARYSTVSEIHRNFRSIEVFEDLAKDILTAACHGGSKFTFDEQTARKWTCEVLFNRTFGTKRIDYFWFRDRLICIARTLELEDYFKSEMGIVLEWAKGKKLKELTTIFWSIHHVAVLIIDGDKISHSDPIPVAAVLDDRAQLEIGLKLITHYLPLLATDGSDVFDSSLPLDVILHIMRFCDPDTQLALGRTSKAVRHEWVQRLHFGPYRLVSLVGDNFSAIDEDGKHVKVKLKPRRCVKYGEAHRRATLTAYRKPIFYVNDFHYRPYSDSDYPMTQTLRPLQVTDFSRIHGYGVELGKLSK